MLVENETALNPTTFLACTLNVYRTPVVSEVTTYCVVTTFYANYTKVVLYWSWQNIV